MQEQPNGMGMQLDHGMRFLRKALCVGAAAELLGWEGHYSCGFAAF